MSIGRVRLAFLSDLHAFHPEPGRASVSYLPTTRMADEPDPFRDLEELIKREQLSVDLVICAGDICDKADFRGFQYAWEKLNNIRLSMSAKELVANDFDGHRHGGNCALSNGA